MDNLEALKPEDPMAVSMRYNYVPTNVFYGKKEEKQVDNNDQGKQEIADEELKDDGTEKEVVAANLIANTVSYRIFASLEGDLIPKNFNTGEEDLIAGNVDTDESANPVADQD